MHGHHMCFVRGRCNRTGMKAIDHSETSCKKRNVVGVTDIDFAHVNRVLEVVHVLVVEGDVEQSRERIGQLDREHALLATERMLCVVKGTPPPKRN